MTQATVIAFALGMLFGSMITVIIITLSYFGSKE